MGDESRLATSTLTLSFSPVSYSSHNPQFQCPCRAGGIFPRLTTCGNNTILPTAVGSCSKGRSTAAVFRKKHFKGHYAAWICLQMETQSGCEKTVQQLALLFVVRFCLSLTASEMELSCEDHPCKHNLWLRQVVGEKTVNL